MEMKQRFKRFVG